MAKSTAGIGPKGKAKAAQVFHEWGKGQLHSGSKKGPVVKNQNQAVAIALNQAREVSGAKRPMPPDMPMQNRMMPDQAMKRK